MKTKTITLTSGRCIFLTIGLLLLSVSLCYSQNKLEITPGKEVVIKSKSLEEERVVSVFLPANYETSSQKYPVIYLLDARTHFQHATSAVNFLSRQGIIPGMIVVAIHNVDRNRDFSPIHDERIPTSGGAEKFLNFVSDELITYVNKNYRTSNFTILMGHSFGGTFAVYSLLAKPKVFDAYIAISPYLHFANNYLIAEANKLLKTNYNSQKYFYMTVGNEPPYFEALGEFNTLIKEKSGKAIDFKYVKMETEDHGSIPYISFFNGLRFIFSGWQVPQEKLNEDLAAIDKHYKNVSKKYDFEIHTPENLINLLGYKYLQSKDIEKAIQVFTENVKRYPLSANVYDSLGEAYENDNQLKLAAENYQKAYELGKVYNDGNLGIYKKNLERVQQNK